MQTNEKRGRMEYTIDLVHVLKSVWRWTWAILLAGILAATGALGYSTLVAKPQYSAQVRMMVQNGTKTESSDGKTEYDWAFTAAELAAAQRENPLDPAYPRNPGRGNNPPGLPDYS